ncbi:MAG: sigma-70 family RNA polymerase sigma factor [Planctomycetes bacterium]|nr:sigma-70 family RNA polymerase sigma factor [Planctomycetota bacterium]
MLKYRNKHLGELAHQLTLSPRRLRNPQLEGIDRLLDLVDAKKSYPYDLVCFHITGHRPLKQNQKPPIAGQAMIADLPTMADHITRKAAIPVADLCGDYETHEVVAKRLGVSTKTIRRWRPRGLVGVRAVCEDGVSRLLFSAKAVERFKERNARLVERGASFKLLTDAEKDTMVEMARAMLVQKRRKLHVVAREIAAQAGRAIETVRYTLRQYDRAHPDDALFANNGQPLLSKRHLAIWTGYEQGETLERIAAAFDCDTESIEAVIREIKARRLKNEPLQCVDNELFHAPNAVELILEAPQPEAAQPATKPIRIPKGLPAYLRNLYETPLLTAALEADLFRRYNFVKFLAARAVEELDVYTVTQAQLDEIQTRLDQVENIKQRIVQANLRLVVSIAKRHVGWSDDLFEVISDGNMSLMRAVEKFDYARGNKFSTYATWAVMKNYARTIPTEHYHMNRYVTGQDERLAAAADVRPAEAPASDLESVREALKDGMATLTERERTIVTQHFGLQEAKGRSLTLEDLGKRFGVTKERIRQIEKRAIAKLRATLSPTLVEVLAG